jgi:hypothetical protein
MAPYVTHVCDCNMSGCDTRQQAPRVWACPTWLEKTPRAQATAPRRGLSGVKTGILDAGGVAVDWQQGLIGGLAGQRRVR